MRLFLILLLPAMLVIAMETFMARYLLIEIDDETEKQMDNSLKSRMCCECPDRDYTSPGCDVSVCYACRFDCCQGGTAPPSFGVHLQLLGCWQDELKMIPKRALESAEGKIDYLEDRYADREDAIKKCYKYALSLGRKVFAIQDGGQCFTAGPDDSYDTFGSSSACNIEDGKGGPMANEVYAINSVEPPEEETTTTPLPDETTIESEVDHISCPYEIAEYHYSSSLLAHFTSGISDWQSCSSLCHGWYEATNQGRSEPGKCVVWSFQPFRGRCKLFGDFDGKLARSSNYWLTGQVSCYSSSE